MSIRSPHDSNYRVGLRTGRHYGESRGVQLAGLLVTMNLFEPTNLPLMCECHSYIMIKPEDGCYDSSSESLVLIIHTHSAQSHEGDDRPSICSKTNIFALLREST